MRTSKMQLISLLVVTVTVTLWILLTLRASPPPQIRLKSLSALGEVCAEQTARLLGHGGSVVLIVAEPDQMKSSGLQIAREAFEHASVKVGLTVDGVETVPSRNPHMTGVGAALSPEQYLEILSNHQSVNAVVSFIGSPSLTDEQIAELPSSRPYCIVFTTPKPSLKPMLQKHVVDLAIIPRYQPAPNHHPRTTQEWFDSRFQIVMQADLSGLP